MQKIIFPISQINEVTDYPYGRLRTKAFFSVEFRPGHGFRSVFQTINPKTDRVNAPKKGTYTTGIEYCYQDVESGHIKYGAYSFSSFEAINKTAAFMQEHAATLQLTAEMVEYLAGLIVVSTKITCKFLDRDFAQVRPFIDGTVTEAVKAMKTGEIDWNKISIDTAAIDALPTAEAAAKWVIEALPPIDILTGKPEEMPMPTPAANPVPVSPEQEESAPAAIPEYAAEEEETEETHPFIIMNDTDHITATMESYKTYEEAAAVIPELRARFKAIQGYYFTNKQERISPDDVIYRIVDTRETWKIEPGKDTPPAAPGQLFTLPGLLF